MKGVSKKIHTVLLSAVLVGQAIPAVPVYAANQTGGLDIDFSLNLPAKGKAFTVQLKDSSGNLQKDEQISSNSAGTKLLYTADAIQPGKYHLEIKGEGYLPYTQEVTITSGYTTKLELYNGQQIGAKFGLMAVGDINGDGKIEKADADAMKQAIEAGSTDAKYDLNGDKKVNVADLLYITLNYEAQNVSATPLQILPSHQLGAQSESGTKVTDGKVENLTAGTESYVQFTPTNGASISKGNPVAFSLNVDSVAAVDGFVIAPPVGSENTITDATILVEDKNRNIHEVTLSGNPYAPMALGTSAATAMQESDGSIVIHLGQQIAVKKVTIKVTGASTNLVDIARVEFVNGMEHRISEPDLNVPEAVQLKQLSAGNNPSFSVSWKKQVNVTGYEVLVREKNGTEAKLETTATALTVSSLNGKLKTATPYTVCVRAVNGQWKSPYSDTATITLMPESAPPAPEGVTVTGQVEAIQVGWKEMRDTESYRIYYRAQGESNYQEISGVTGTSYTIRSLKADKKYEIYVVGQNQLGDSPRSEVKQVTTLAAEPLAMPKYKLINTVTKTGEKTAHIKEVDLMGYQAENTFAIVDGDISTYAVANTWDTGGYNVGRGGPIITLDAEYEMDTIRFAASVGQDRYPYIRVYALDKEDVATKVFDSQENSWQYKTDANGNPYYELKLTKPIKAQKLQLCVANYSTAGDNSISEVAFYYYDSLANDIEALFTDVTHIALQEDVTKDTLDTLSARLETVDSVSGESHPDQASLQLILQDAYALLAQNVQAQVVSVDMSVTAAADGHLDFAYSLSDLQPLGKAVEAGETINVYVGAEGKTTGASTNLQLVFTQNHGEWDIWSQEVPLVVGQNSFTVPNISNRSGEAGGAIYVRYTGQKDKEQYSVRVSGGTEIPVLDVAGKSGTKRTEAIAQYLQALQSHVSTLTEQHEASDATAHDGSYEKTTCILNYTDLVLDGMLYSVPATAVWETIQSDPTNKLTTALAAMEQEIHLLYQHKGLHEAATNSNRYPAQRLNIRYQKMFDGAFMYAGSKHIGIEFGSVGELFGITPVTTDEKGNQISGQLSGWGIAHEIGHVINNKSYATAEITNNYYAILATGDTRSNYEKVYRAVTSGGTSDGATALAMYWQLHMYYDAYGDYKTFDTAEEQQENLFFARMDSYSRDTANAPQPGGVALTLSDSKSDNLIRLACAAAEQNLLSFFEAWGFAYDATTKQYAAQFTEKAPAVQYMNPTAQVYQLNGGKGMADDTEAEASICYNGTGKTSNQVTLGLSNTDGTDAMLGYEIWRNGEVVAFVPADETSYTDIISTGNNRVYQYEVVAYDKLLQKTDAVTLKPVKVTHDGTLGKEKWTLTTTMTSTADKFIMADGSNGYCADTTISAISNLLEGRDYTGTVSRDGAEIMIKLGEMSQLTALRYGGDAARVQVSVSGDGKKWETVYTGQVDGQGGLLYFQNPDEPNNLYVCEVEYVKLTFPDLLQGDTITVSQLDLLAPAGDNLEWLDSGTIGILQKDYIYSAGEKISAGSLVFVGSYKGNPAYNVVLLRDESGKIIEGSQVILASELEADAMLGDVAEGTWIYWIEPADMPQNLPGKVMAELYRVDDAMTMEGQRLVSDTLYVAIPENLPQLKLDGLAEEGNAPAAVQLAAPAEKTVEMPEIPALPVEEAEEEPIEAPVISDEEDKEENDDEVEEAPAMPEEGAPTEQKTAPAEAEAEKAQPDITDAAEKQPLEMALSLQGTPARTIQVQVTAQNTPKFTWKAGTGNAKLSLNMGDATAQATIAMQTTVSVSDGVTNVSMDWAKGVAKNALLKDCSYDAKAGEVHLYITAKQDLLDGGVLDIGTLSLQTADGTKAATLTIRPDSTVLVGSDYTELQVSSMDSPAVRVNMTQSGSSGSHSNGSSSDKTSSDKNVSKEEKADTMPAEDADTIPVDSNVPTENPFADVTQQDYFYDAVLWAVSNGITSGTSASSFSPAASCTRAEMVTFLWRAAGKPIVEQKLAFVDVPRDAYYYDAVCWAVSEGITSGTSATAFSPDATVTRGQTASFLWRANGKPDASGNAFMDVAEADYYAKAIAWAAEQGITSGTGMQTFSPQDACTRGQIVTFLYRAQK